MSTFSGLLVSMSGAMAHDIYGNMLRPKATQADRLKAFKIAAIPSLRHGFGASRPVGGAVRHRDDGRIGVRDRGRLVLPASAARRVVARPDDARRRRRRNADRRSPLHWATIVCSMAIDKKWLILEVSPQLHTVMEQPAIWGVPLSIAIMIVVSLATAETGTQKDIALKMLRLHAPEELGVSKNYIEAEGDH